VNKNNLEVVVEENTNGQFVKCPATR
jgi:hypothetical protein